MYKPSVNVEEIVKKKNVPQIAHQGRVDAGEMVATLHLARIMCVPRVK